MSLTIYLRLYSRVDVKQESTIRLNDLAQIVAEEDIIEKLFNLMIYQFNKESEIIVIDILDIVKIIREQFPEVNIESYGPSQTIVTVMKNKRKMSIPLFALVWILLFIGSGLAIMNFHEETGMQAVHQRIYWMVTGNESTGPLMLQVPYSLGIGLGMALFFNHIFKKKINDEPSPLDIELFNYQQNIDQYIVAKDKERDKT